MEDMNMNQISDEEFMKQMEEGAFAEETEEVVSQEEPEKTSPVYPEQPEQDSVNTANDEDSKVAVKEEPKEDGEETAESEESAEDGNSEDTKTKDSDSEDDVLNSYLNQVSKVKANRQEIEFTNSEKLAQFDSMYQKAADYTKKTQKLSQFGKRISAMEELGMTDDQFNTMLDVLKGDEDAITSVLKGAGIDALELDTEKELDYTPHNYGKSELELTIEDAYSEIDSDDEGVVTRDVIANQFDERSRSQIVNGMTLPNGVKLSTKEIMIGIHEDVKNGEYQKVSPMMTKLKLQGDGSKSDIEYYIEAGAQYNRQKVYMAQQASKQADEAKQRAQAEAKLIADTKAKQAQRELASQDAEKRQSAAITQGTAGTSGSPDQLDTAKMSDEEFMKWMDSQMQG